MEVITCLDCKKQTDVVIDYQSGDTICTECGLILDSHYIVDYFDRNISHMTSPIRTKLKVGTNGLRNPNPNLVDKASSTSYRISSPSCSSHKDLLEDHHTRLIEELMLVRFDCLVVYLRLMYDYKSMQHLPIIRFSMIYHVVFEADIEDVSVAAEVASPEDQLKLTLYLKFVQQQKQNLLCFSIDLEFFASGCLLNDEIAHVLEKFASVTTKL
ncbi:PREDICTED: uncharacterized protein LOC104734020 [Camelina sativa]|uniref:Uncharacterized protein LOC104734020 n=1 Tax=Camelina sativa TaxID=90675 RepID=A0ABM0V6V6_CAMSA|nr:PREDICTED: uncharacterized protein LOC104734020 [Camelina sativa]